MIYDTQGALYRSYLNASQSGGNKCGCASLSSPLPPLTSPAEPLRRRSSPRKNLAAAWAPKTAEQAGSGDGLPPTTSLAQSEQRSAS